MYIQRFIEKAIQKSLILNKVIVVYGTRQVGKTTLVRHILTSVKEPHLFVSGEDNDVRPWLSSESLVTLKQYIGKHTLLVIDEAQRIPNIGINLKLIVDHIDGVRILVTGSSSFDIANQVGEPLVGRKRQFTLYPFAQMELSSSEPLHETKALLPSRMIFGAYPKVITTSDIREKREILESLIDGYLFRDILVFEDIKKSSKLLDILKLLAFQIGSEVSLNEIGQQIGMDSRTIEKYLDILEKIFIIKRINGFSRNLRKEVTKTSRYYFCDNGVRNAIINNFNNLDIRNDVGQLWENYIVMERLKRQEYTSMYANTYFWRTYDQKEIDFVEEREGKLFGYEIKWKKEKKSPPREWLETYPEASYECITQENYLEFIR